MDWLNLLAVQGTLKSVLKHHSSKASILWSSAFFMKCCQIIDLRKEKLVYSHLTLTSVGPLPN